MRKRSRYDHLSSRTLRSRIALLDAELESLSTELAKTVASRARLDAVRSAAKQLSDQLDSQVGSLKKQQDEIRLREWEKQSFVRKMFFDDSAISADASTRIAALQQRIDTLELQRQPMPHSGDDNYWELQHRRNVALDNREAAQQALNRKVSKEAREAPRRAKTATQAALAAAHVRASRELADTVKKHVARTERCPYCDGPLGDLPHTDHIYPVAKGGLSDEANLVNICQECNRKKRSRTLREFILELGLDRERIEATLVRLKKRF